MNKLWLKVFLVAVIVIHCGSAQAGWFDGKKKSAGKVKQKVSTEIAKTQAGLPANSAVEKASVEKGNAVVQKASLAAPAAVGVSTTKNSGQFFDVGPSGVVSDKELAAENLKKEQGKVRLSEDEMKKVKEEMEKLQQGIRTARDAQQVAQTAKSQVVRPVSIPSIPKLPVLTGTAQAVPAAPVRPESYKNPAATSGYKK